MIGSSYTNTDKERIAIVEHRMKEKVRNATNLDVISVELEGRARIERKERERERKKFDTQARKHIWTKENNNYKS